jgi:Arc/MetJ family transcription regulator
MRTNVVIDDKLMHRALKSGNYPTKKAAGRIQREIASFELP